ncbi:hypothetical protein H0H92_005200 [Tricholoma furcatifolium]|nr:hypothetical protein H0H92_005200 [Tricholoma furcatifolium]
MRDKDGRVLVNAHVMGFLRRISKLLFYGIKPVFVFDGGAPDLKKMTLRERREKKSGAAASHAKLAEKLLAAHMRREALNHADTSASKSKKKPVPVLDENTVYLEDIESTLTKTPARKKPPTPSSSSKKAKFYDHDPYKLPDVDLEAAVAKATRNTAPDPRLATEEELRAFIDEMRPEDFDVTSPAFRELPTEVQYEIVGDLRLKSRQTSYARLQKMLRNAQTPMDFSKQQIKNLQQRNTLTQQLLVTTDSIGSAHISIPVRIASERNKEYVLMKNEGESGGWILGIRNDGTKEKPIEIDQDEPVAVDEDSDEGMEEVPISVPTSADPDLREYQRSMALSAIGNRSITHQPVQRSTIDQRIERERPLFDLADDDELQEQLRGQLIDDDADDPMLAIAIQASIEQQAVQMNKSRFGPSDASSSKLPSTPLLQATVLRESPSTGVDDVDFMFNSPSRLETALTFANASSTRPPLFSPHSQKNSLIFGRPTLLTSSSHPEASSQVSQLSATLPSIDKVNNSHTSPVKNPPGKQKANSEAVHLPLPEPHQVSPTLSEVQLDSEDEDMEEVVKFPSETSHEKQAGDRQNSVASTKDKAEMSLEVFEATQEEEEEASSNVNPIRGISAEPTPRDIPTSAFPNKILEYLAEDSGPLLDEPLFAPSPKDDDEEFIPWSRSPSPFRESPDSEVLDQPPASVDELSGAVDVEARDAEEEEYARFISQVKGKNIEDARHEIDEEIKFLNQQRKAAMRDSEDITQQMIAQIMVSWSSRFLIKELPNESLVFQTMLRLFGIPYITAPMEAEAQCAELVTLGLVDGVITDDSDVFLFGAQRVFKNMFNQSKTVECFLLSDLSRDLGIERDTLIRLAYLLGSDYTDGLPGVGPVVAMEILKEFPGESGLVDFRNWWMKVQSGKDKDEDNKTKFRKQFKKKFKSLFMTEDWPNPAVRDAYYHPTVDSSKEPFKWGMPDLDALRAFFHGELGWSQAKVDEILLPIIQKMNKRGQAAALNKQGNLTDFFDITAGSGTFAPKKRQAYTSKRLQNVVDDFRRKRDRSSDDPESHSQSEDESTKPAKKRVKSSTKGKSRGGSTTKTSKRGGKKTHLGTSRLKKPLPEDNDDNNSEEFEALEDTAEAVIPLDPVMVARLRPRPELKRKEGRELTAEEDTASQM